MPRRATRGSPALGALPPGAGRRRRGAARARADARDRPRRDRPRGAARRRGRRPAARTAGIAVFGPSAAAARIEGSKSFAKDVMEAAGVPTARDARRRRAAPCVVKADGLAAGKGVFVCRTEEELDAGARAAARASAGRVVVEELLEGEEVSVFALCDGEARRPARRRARPQAHRRRRHRPEHRRDGRVLAGAGLRAAEVEELVDRIHRPVLDELARRGVAVRRRALRGPDADRRRAAGARVQLPVRRPRDAVAAAAPRGRPARRRSPRPRPATSAASQLARRAAARR